MTYAAYPGSGPARVRRLAGEDPVARATTGARCPSAENRRSIGYAMTEKQGGSDLRQTQTTARFAETTSRRPRLSAERPQVVLLRAAVGRLLHAGASRRQACRASSCPASCPTARRNPLRMQRLKDKCGNRSNASSEVEYHDALAWLVGEEGHGIREILEHAHLTRLDFAIGSAGLMRQALTLALNHAQTRRGFGPGAGRSADDDQHPGRPRHRLRGLHAAGVPRRARHRCDAGERGQERSLARVATPLAKFWNCKRAPAFVAEALECHGGNGFIEENPMARLYREAPLNGIWEGTSNMMCMDVLRGLRRDPAHAEVFMAEVMRAKGADQPARPLARPARHRNRPTAQRRRPCPPPVQHMAYALQASELHEHAITRSVRGLLPIAPAGRLGPRVRHARLDARAEGHRRARHCGGPLAVLWMR